MQVESDSFAIYAWFDGNLVLRSNLGKAKVSDLIWKDSFKIWKF